MKITRSELPQIIDEMMMVVFVLQLNVVLVEFRFKHVYVTLVAVHASHQSLIGLHEPAHREPANKQRNVTLYWRNGRFDDVNFQI